MGFTQRGKEEPLRPLGRNDAEPPGFQGAGAELPNPVILSCTQICWPVFYPKGFEEMRSIIYWQENLMYHVCFWEEETKE